MHARMRRTGHAPINLLQCATTKASMPPLCTANAWPRQCHGSMNLPVALFPVPDARWIVFVACAFLQASAGLNYSFSVFAPALKELFHLDEVQLGTVATLGFNMGGERPHYKTGVGLEQMS